MEGKPKVVTAADDLVDDVDHERGTVQPDPAAVPGGAGQRRIAVMLGGPLDRVADVLGFQFRGPGLAQPQERAAFGRLTAAVQLDRVVGDGGPEVGPPGWLAVIAVGTGV